MSFAQTHRIRPVYTFRTQIIDIQIKLFDAMLEAECILFIIRAALKRTNLADRLAKEAEEKAEAERKAKEAEEKAEPERLANEATAKAGALAVTPYIRLHTTFTNPVNIQAIIRRISTTYVQIILVLCTSHT